MPVTFVLKQPQNNLGPQLVELMRVLNFIRKHGLEKAIVFDFKDITFVHPLFILSLTAIYSQLKNKSFNSEKESGNGWREVNSDIASYLQNIRFPEGMNPDNYSSPEEATRSYLERTYIPIVNFSASKREEKTKIRNNFLSGINSLLENNLQLNSQYKSGISYLISEMTDNIVDHSGVEKGWLFAQYYPKKKYLNVCIIDNGKTILGSYKEAGIMEIKNDSEAIRQAMKGKSTKGIERGSGIRTSRKMIVEGLNGQFALFSGKGLLINDRLISLPVKWNGTILALRIPKNVKNFQYGRYI